MHRRARTWIDLALLAGTLLGAASFLGLIRWHETVDPMELRVRAAPVAAGDLRIPADWQIEDDDRGDLVVLQRDGIVAMVAAFDDPYIARTRAQRLAETRYDRTKEAGDVHPAPEIATSRFDDMPATQFAYLDRSGTSREWVRRVTVWDAPRHRTWAARIATPVIAGRTHPPRDTIREADDLLRSMLRRRYLPARTDVDADDAYCADPDETTPRARARRAFGLEPAPAPWC